MDQEFREGREVFARLVREHKRGVFSVAYAKLRNAHDAEDVMQDVFIEAYRNFHKLRNPSKIRAWLHSATVYRCRDHVRKAMRREKRELAFVDLRLNNPSTDVQIERELCDTVLDAIERLPEEYRVVVLLKHFARLSYADISKMTGLSEPTIGNRLQAARKKLRDELIEMHEGVDQSEDL